MLNNYKKYNNKPLEKNNNNGSTYAVKFLNKIYKELKQFHKD